MRAPRTLLLVTRNFPPARGGIETMAWELARHGSREGVDVVLLHVGQKRCEAPPPGLRAYIHLPGTGRWAALAASALAVPFLAWRLKPDRIVHMQVTTGLGGFLALRTAGIPYCVLGLGLELLPGATEWFRRLRGGILGRARKVISISRYTDGLAARLGAGGNRAVLNPGTRLWAASSAVPDRARHFGPGSGDVFVILSLSRLVPRKGVDKALEALALVLRRRKDILYAVAGSGPDLPRLTALAEEKGVAAHVRFLGKIADEDMGGVYASADLFVLPSRESRDPPDAEGFGIVFLEAGACGTPSLGGASGGIPDAILEGRTGFLVDPLDPAAIADKILLLMEDRALLQRLGAGAKAHAESQSWEQVCGRYYAAVFA